MSSGNDLLQHLLRVVPEFGTPLRDVAITGDDSVVRDLMPLPGRPLRAAIEQHRLKTVDGRRELRLRSRTCLELLPERAKLPSLVDGQETEEAVSRDRLPFALGRHRGGVVGEGVARVDFHQVVDDDHLEDAQDIQSRMVCMLREHEDA